MELKIDLSYRDYIRISDVEVADANRIFSPEVEWPAFLLIQIVEFGYDDGAITCSNKTQNTSLRLSLDRRHANTIHEVTLNPTN